MRAAHAAHDRRRSSPGVACLASPAWRRGPRRPRAPRRRPRAAARRWAMRCGVARARRPLITRLNSAQSTGAEVVVAALGVPAQVRVGQRDAERLGLRHGHVDEPLPQLVVGVPLDPPGHRLRGVGRVVVGRAEHHQRRPPPAVRRVLHHRPLRRRCRASSSSAARSPAAGGTTPPCRCGSSPARTGRRSCGTAAPGCRSPRRRPASRSRRRRRSVSVG